MSLIRCEKVSFTYEGKTVLSEISFAVEKGDYLCIVGENGAGKSTLLKGILRLKNPSTGNITSGDGLKTDKIGYLPQQTVVQKDFPASVFEVVLSGRLNGLGALPFYRKSDKEDALRQLKLLGVDELKNRCYRELSGGQQQRVLLARALCAGRELLALDEPVAGLDPVMTGELYRLIDRVNKTQARTIIMVSHDIRGVIQYASHILHLSKTQVFFGKKEDYVNCDMGMHFLGGEADV
jgi:zinc transport system ATP-binding protein